MGVGCFAYAAMGATPVGVTPRTPPPFSLAITSSYLNVAVSGESSLPSSPTMKGLSTCTTGYSQRKKEMVSTLLS